VGDDKLQHGVAEKLQALVVAKAGAFFVGEAFVAERGGQKLAIAESVTQVAFERGKIERAG
jgi:hypothetical protein